MIAAIIHWSLHNRVLVLMAAIVLLVTGIYTIKYTPVDAIPDLSDVQVIIKTSFPGQSPQVVEDQITYPLTTAMLAVPASTTVRGFSYFGDSYVYVLFADGTDLYWARSRVLEYLSQVAGQLPAGVTPELGPDATGVGWVYQYALVDKTGQHNLADLRSLQDWFLKYELQALTGVAEVATVGGMVKQYQVTLDPNRLRAYGLTLAEVKQAIERANQEVGGSVIELAEAEYMVRSQGYLNQLADLKKVPLRVSEQGIPLLLGDIATIGLGPEMRRGIAELNGQGEVVGGVIVLRQGENARATIHLVKTKLAQLADTLPAGVEIVEVYDRSTLIQRAIHTLNKTLVKELIIVSLVCMLFLFHFRSSLIIVLFLPLGVLSAFIIMYWQGINANIMSLSGIALAIGTMVDAAIVMIENVHKAAEKSPLTEQNRWQVIEKAAIEVGPPLFFSLLIITLSFLPVFALQAQEGKLFSPLAFTKTYAMAAAAGLSITLVPVLMGYFIRGKIRAEQANPINRLLIAWYQPILKRVLNKPKTVFLITIFLIVSASWPLLKLGSEFMPELDEGDWMYMPTTLPAISIGKAQQLLQQTDKLIATVPEVKSVFGKMGRAETATDPAPLTMIETVIQFKPRNEWRQGMTTEKLRDELNRAVDLPGITNAWVMPIKTRIDMLATGIKTPVGIKVTGPSLAEIQSIGKAMQPILETIPGTASVYPDRAVGGRYIDIDIDRKAAARYGLNVADIQEVVQTAIGGMNVTQTVEGLERYPVNLRYPQAWRNSLEKLQLLPITTAIGANIPLLDVAKVNIVDGPPVIKTENARPTGWILVDIRDRDVGSYITEAKTALAKHLTLPAGYTLTWSGQFEYMARAKQRLTTLIPLTLLIIIALLYINFRRMPEILIILGTLPLALVGSVWLLYGLGYYLSVAVGVGLIALAGIAVEIGVIMLTYLNLAFGAIQAKANQAQRQLTLDDLHLAIMHGALLRVRPIVMTVIATIAGLLPMMLSTGTGSEIMHRVAAPMVGGLVSAILLTLIVIPVTFLVWKKRQLV
jgi:copper/silver efflux system protein